MIARHSLEFLFLLLAVDLAFVLVHATHVFTAYLPEAHFSVETDRGLAELAQYLKEYWIVLVLCWLSVSMSRLQYCAWAALFFYVLLDDAFLVHEKVGLRLAQELSFPDAFRLRAVDFGEMMVWGIAAAVLLPLVMGAYATGDRPFRERSRWLVALMAVFVLFGGFFDMLHIAVTGSFGHRLLGIIEDGGEMVVMSVIAAYAFALLRSTRLEAPARAPVPLLDRCNGRLANPSYAYAQEDAVAKAESLGSGGSG